MKSRFTVRRDARLTTALTLISEPAADDGLELIFDGKTLYMMVDRKWRMHESN